MIFIILCLYQVYDITLVLPCLIPELMLYVVICMIIVLKNPYYVLDMPIRVCKQTSI